MDIPKYLQIENELKKEIISGKFKYGDKFYSEAQLKDKFNVSSITVIRAVKDLVKAGYLVRHQGKGTFISRSRKDKLVRLSDNEVFSNKQEEDSPVCFLFFFTDRMNIEHSIMLEPKMQAAALDL